MWIFDGEQWTTDEGVTESETRKRDERPKQFDEFQPELQVIEIVTPTTTPKPSYVPFPQP